MNIAANKVVALQITLKDAQGQVIEKSEPGDPLYYIHGTESLVPALEQALEGKTTGDKMQLHLTAAEAYGEYDEEQVEVVAKADFEDQKELAVGKEFHYEDEGQVYYVRIVKIEGDEVTIDANHPLAGKDLDFDLEVLSVRDASPEELDHGHVHGEGGHNH